MGKVNLFLPWLGEFGGELLYWAPKVYACRTPKIVCFEKGKECLYPAVHAHAVDRIPEKNRKTWGAPGVQGEIHNRIVEQFGGDGIEVLEPINSRQLKIHRKWFIPKVKDYGFKCDVVIFPRWRTTAAARNFRGWPEIVDALIATGLEVFVGGTKDMSVDLGVNAAWHYDNELEATIHAIMHSNVRAGTPTGTMLLSLMCGKSVLAITTPANLATDNHFKTIDHLGAGWDRIHVDFDETGKVIDAICEHNKLHG